MTALEVIPTACECDNTHEANNIVCRLCWLAGRRTPADPMPARWYIRSGPKKGPVVWQGEHGDTLSIYTCTFVDQNFIDTAGRGFTRRSIEFFARRPTKAAKMIAQFGAPMAFDKKVID